MSEVKNSNVVSVEYQGTYDSNYGTLYQYVYTMEDGVKIKANHKTQEPRSGAISYEIQGELGQGLMRGKVGRPVDDLGFAQPTSTAKAKPQQENRNKSFALSYAKDLFVGKEINAEAVIVVADKFLEWLDKDPAIKEYQETPVTPPPHLKPGANQGQTPPPPTAQPTNELQF